MADVLASAALDHEKHLLLDQSLLRLPIEFSRQNLKSAQIQLKTAQDKVTEIVTVGGKAVIEQASKSGEDVEAGLLRLADASLDQAIARLQTLKRKLSALNENTQALHKQAEARVRHLEDLYAIPTLADVKYEGWSRIRLDRLLVDYLLRMGYTDSAQALAREKDIQDLVDCAAFEQCRKVERSLRMDRKVDIALSWCNENKGSLKKLSGNSFEYELRLQQFIELARAGHRTADWRTFNEAKAHASKYLVSHPDLEWKSRAAILFAVPPKDDGDVEMNGNTTNHSYQYLYSSERWSYLSSLFLETHNTLFQLPQSPLLHMALTAGLSALKTPACHSKFLSPSSGLNAATSPTIRHAHTNSQQDIGSSPPPNDDFDSMDSILSNSNATAASLTSSVCPICSTELNKLSKQLPFANQTKCHVENDPVVLPNGRVYGRERLERLNEKLGTPAGYIKDPMDLGTVYRAEVVQKVYIL